MKIDATMPDIPSDYDYRWRVVAGISDPPSRFMLLERRKSFLGIKWWAEVARSCILTGAYSQGWDKECASAARDCLKDYGVNHFLPTGVIE